MNNKNTFLAESVIYGLTGALSKFSVFLTIPIYTRYLTITEFGMLDLYLTISMIIYIFLETQMQSGFMRSYYEKQQEGTLSELTGSIFLYYISGYIFIFSIFVMFYILDFKSKYLILEYIFPVLLVILPKQIFDLNNIVMRMEHEAKKYMIFNCSYVFLIAILGVFSVIFLSPDVKYILWSTFIGNLVFGIVAFINIRNKIGIKYKFIYFKETFYYSAPLVPIIIGSWAMSGVSRVYISEYLTFADLGLYSFALKLGMIFLLFVQAFRTAWDPFVIKKFGEKSTQSKKVFSKALNYYITLGLIVIFIIYSISPLLINILATDEYLAAKNILPILLFAYFWQGGLNIISIGNSWVRKTYLNIFGSATGSIVVVISTSYLVQIYSLSGVAIGQLIGFTVHFFITMYFAQRNIYINYNKFYLLFIFLISIIISIYQII